MELYAKLEILWVYWVVFDEPTDEDTVAAAPQQKAIPG